jgi:hypothetical protein
MELTKCAMKEIWATKCAPVLTAICIKQIFQYVYNILPIQYSAYFIENIFFKALWKSFRQTESNLK